MTAETPRDDSRARLREAAAARMPEGTWRRRLASAGLATVRHGRTFAKEVRDDVRRGVGGALPTTYRGWRRSHGPRRAELAHQRRLALTHGNGLGHQ